MAAPPPTLAAQRTRLHTTEELSALGAAVEEHFLVGAVVWFDLTDFLEGVEAPTLTFLDASTRACLAAVRGVSNLAWTPGGVALQA